MINKENSYKSEDILSDFKTLMQVQISFAFGNERKKNFSPRELIKQ